MFLNDGEILGLVDSGVIANVDLDKTGRKLTYESLVQPCSLDLTIGKIFVPGVKADELGGSKNPKLKNHSLGQGETALVETTEEFNLPQNIGGFGFPPARVSRNGILMTNPGHIDPGYHGKLSFTLVNMGKEPNELRKGDLICTVLLFKMDNPPQHDLQARGQTMSSTTDWSEVLIKLSHDFMEIDDRAKEAAKKQVKEAELKLKNWQVWVPLLTSIIAIVGLVVNFSITQTDVDARVADLESTLPEVEAQVTTVTDQVNQLEGIWSFESRLGSLEDKIRDIESSIEP